MARKPKTKAKAKKAAARRGRIQSWFRFEEYSNRGDAFKAARSAMSNATKKGKEVQMALVSLPRKGEIAYYVGSKNHIAVLKNRFDIEIKK